MKKSFFYPIISSACIFIVCSSFFLVTKSKYKKELSSRLSYTKKRDLAVPSDIEPDQNVLLPRRLSSLRSGEELGIVVDVKKISIRNVYPYNPTLIRKQNGYDLFFRYDEISVGSKVGSYFANIGVVHLDENFEQGIEEFKRIALTTRYAEDPRLIELGDDLYVFYNDIDINSASDRTMCVARLDRETYEVKYTTTLDLNLAYSEKNWVPFEYVDKQQQSHLLLEYRLQPRKLFELLDPTLNEIRNINLPRDVAFHDLNWSSFWGEIRGGAPAQKQGNEYLGFFHSSFVDKGIRWFTIGAYMFEGEYPFRLTKVSPYPILFKGLYDTKIMHTAAHNKRVIYPCGFVFEKQGDKTYIKLACGENDCGVKVLTINKDELIQGMVQIEN